MEKAAQIGGQLLAEMERRDAAVIEPPGTARMATPRPGKNAAPKRPHGPIFAGLRGNAP